MSNSDFNCNKWSKFVIIQIFGEGIITCHRCHCCFASPFVLRLVKLLRSRRCLCVGTHLISAINWQLYPHTSLPGSASRLSICCCGDVWYGWMCSRTGWLLSVSSCVSGVGGCIKYSMWFVVLRLLIPPLPEAVLLSLGPRNWCFFFKKKRGYKQVWQDARCVISTNRCSIRELKGETHRSIHSNETLP